MVSVFEKQPPPKKKKKERKIARKRARIGTKTKVTRGHYCIIVSCTHTRLKLVNFIQLPSIVTLMTKKNRHSQFLFNKES